MSSMHAIAPDDLVATFEEANANERPPLLVLRPLEEFLDRAGLGEGELEIAPVGEGHSNVTYAIRRGETEFVLRRPPRPPLPPSAPRGGERGSPPPPPPRPPLPPSAHDVGREARVLRALEGRARVPKVLAACDDDSVIGAPFSVTELVEGHVITDAIPPELDSEDDHRRMSEELVDALVEVHA